MKDERTDSRQLGDEQLEAVSGGAGGDFSIQGTPCKWNANGDPTHWIDPNNKQRFHYRCRDCGALLHGIGNGFLQCSRCGVIFFRSGATKVYLDVDE